MTSWFRTLGVATTMTVIIVSEIAFAAWPSSGDGHGQATVPHGALILTIDASGDPEVSVQDIEAAEDRVAQEGRAGWQDRAQDLLNMLKQAARGVCGLPVLPKQIALDAGVVRLTWGAKDVCGGLAFASHDELTAKAPRPVQFQLTARGGQSAPAEVQRFVSELSRLLCTLPLRPSDITLALPPARIEWSIRDMCKA